MYTKDAAGDSWWITDGHLGVDRSILYLAEQFECAKGTLQRCDLFSCVLFDIDEAISSNLWKSEGILLTLSTRRL